MAERYYNQQVEGWWEEQPTIEHALQRLLHKFATKMTPAQSMKIFTVLKNSKRRCTEHYLFFVAVSEACGGSDNLVQDNILHYADPSMRVSVLARLYLTRIDYLRQAEELSLRAVDRDRTAREEYRKGRGQYLRQWAPSL